MKAIKALEQELSYIQVELKRKPSIEMKNEEERVRQKIQFIREVKHAAKTAGQKRRNKIILETHLSKGDL